MKKGCTTATSNTEKDKNISTQEDKKKNTTTENPEIDEKRDINRESARGSKSENDKYKNNDYDNNTKDNLVPEENDPLYL